MTATLSYKYSPLRKEKYITFIQGGKELLKSGLFSGLFDSFKNTFAQIILTNTGLQLYSNNDCVGEGLSKHGLTQGQTGLLRALCKGLCFIPSDSDATVPG